MEINQIWLHLRTWFQVEKPRKIKYLLKFKKMKSMFMKDKEDYLNIPTQIY